MFTLLHDALKVMRVLHIDKRITIEYTIVKQRIGGAIMNFCGIRELSNNTKAVLENVSQGNKVIITDNGKPSALMIQINEENFERILSMVQQLEMQANLSAIWDKASQDFPTGMTEEDIEEEISAVRRGD